MGKMFRSQLDLTPKRQWRARILWSLGILLLGLFLAGLTFLNLLGSKPELQLTVGGSPPDNFAGPFLIGRKPSLGVTVKVPKNDLCGLLVSIIQEGRETILLHQEMGGIKWIASRSPVIVTHAPLDYGGRAFKEGGADWKIVAKDCSLWRCTTEQTHPLIFDLTAPRVSITSTQHYINQAGADVVTYRVAGDVAWTAARVGPNLFPGFPKPGAAKESGDYFAFVVHAHDLTEATPIEVLARDRAGNESVATQMPARFFPKQFRHRDLVIEDTFIETKVADIITNTPELSTTGDNLKNFLLVNRELRKKNNQFIKKLSESSAPSFYWSGAFKPLTNASIEASFADYRNYLYKGEKVDQQVHLGFDMAVTLHYPIYASGAGKILFADYLGIYGNTVIIDHGYGLISLYGHLSSIDVKAAQMVAREEKIGNSGESGLAGGDHLHFSMLINGVQTNPIEFWDQHWIDDHVMLRLGPL